jgi:hypothetical protein
VTFVIDYASYVVFHIVSVELYSCHVLTQVAAPCPKLASLEYRCNSVYCFNVIEVRVRNVGEVIRKDRECRDKGQG